MQLKAELRDSQEALHSQAERIETWAFDIMNLTTEEIRSDTENYVVELVSDLRAEMGLMNNAILDIEARIATLRKYF